MSEDPFDLPKQGDPGSTFIAVVLDRSGSMGSVQKQTIDGFNKFVKDQKALPGTAHMTLTQFDHEYEIVYSAKSIKQVPPLTSSTYVPRGNTALFDAMSRTILDTKARVGAMAPAQQPSRVVVLVVSDGHENASREVKGADVRRLVDECRTKLKWDFVFLGCEEAGLRDAAHVGTQAVAYVAGAEGTQKAWNATSGSVRNYRGGVLRGQSLGSDISSRLKN